MRKVIILSMFALTLGINSCGKSAEQIALEEKAKNDSINLAIESAKRIELENRLNMIENEKAKNDLESKIAPEEAPEIETEFKEQYINPIEDFAGYWNVSLKVLESDCRSIPQGTILSQIWVIEVTGDNAKVKVENSDNISTTYSGQFNNETLTLISEITNMYGAKELRTKYQLKKKNSKTITGIRETILNGSCVAKYKVTLTN